MRTHSNAARARRGGGRRSSSVADRPNVAATKSMDMHGDGSGDGAAKEGRRGDGPHARTIFALCW